MHPLHAALSDSYAALMLSTLLDFLFPDKDGQITDAQWNQVPFMPYLEAADELRGRGITNLDSLLSATYYHESELLQKTIALFKYKKMQGLCPRLANLIVRASLAHVHYDMTLVPVPLHISRLFSRGFNQSELLARTVAREIDAPVSNMMWRSKDTGHQAWRTKEERHAALSRVFFVKPVFRTLPSHIVLIDDIVTTGVTLDACAESLKDAGVKRVDAWVIARA